MFLFLSLMSPSCVSYYLQDLPIFPRTRDSSISAYLSSLQEACLRHAHRIIQTPGATWPFTPANLAFVLSASELFRNKAKIPLLCTTASERDKQISRLSLQELNFCVAIYRQAFPEFQIQADIEHQWRNLNKFMYAL